MRLMSSSDSVLLQVVPVTLYGSKGYFNTYAMLDTGSTCSLLATDVAKNLGLEGPVESVLLNGIQKSSRLLTKRVVVQVRTKLGWTVTGPLPSYMTVNLFTRFTWQPLMKCFMKQFKLGGGPRTLDVNMTVMCSVLSKMKRC